MPITHHDHPGISYGRFAKRPYKIIDKHKVRCFRRSRIQANFSQLDIRSCIAVQLPRRSHIQTGFSLPDIYPLLH